MCQHAQGEPYRETRRWRGENLKDVSEQRFATGGSAFLVNMPSRLIVYHGSAESKLGRIVCGPA